MDVVKTEACLRLCVTALLVLTCFLVGFDSQTKVIFSSIAKKATFRDLNTVIVLVFIESAAAAYNLLQLVLKCFLSNRFKADLNGPYRRNLAWLCFLLDQAATYTVFATTLAAFEASIVAATGVHIFQWMKLCDRYTRFCFQMGGALLCGFVASLLMVLLSWISAFNLFRLSSPKHFLLLKKGPMIITN